MDKSMMTTSTDLLSWVRTHNVSKEFPLRPRVYCLYNIWGKHGGCHLMRLIQNIDLYKKPDSKIQPRGIGSWQPSLLITELDYAHGSLQIYYTPGSSLTYMGQDIIFKLQKCSHSLQKPTSSDTKLLQSDTMSTPSQRKQASPWSSKKS